MVILSWFVVFCVSLRWHTVFKWNACAGANIRDLVVESPTSLLQLILDYTPIPQLVDSMNCNHQHLKTLKFHCCRLCYSLYCERYKRIESIPRSNNCKH